MRTLKRHYYEHIIRCEDELSCVREYIANNSKKWDLDRENPDVSILENPLTKVR